MKGETVKILGIGSQIRFIDGVSFQVAAITKTHVRLTGEKYSMALDLEEVADRWAHGEFVVETV
jgi:hypothetical protein